VTLPTSSAEGMDPLFLLIDQKLEHLRGRTDELVKLQHTTATQVESYDRQQEQKLHQHQMALKELENQLQYLSHKIQIQIKDLESGITKIQHETRTELVDIHFSCKEQIDNLARRLEVLEKLIL
jgi:chromosome segregation ATPase